MEPQAPETKELEGQSKVNAEQEEELKVLVKTGLREVEENQSILLTEGDADVFAPATQTPLGNKETKQEVKHFVPPEELFSKKTWGSLEIEQILQNQIVVNLGFERPSKIQAISIQSILSNPPKHFIGQAQSGSEKTGAFLISAIQKIKQTNDFSLGPKVICIAPTREEAGQVFSVALQLLKDEKNVTLGLLIPTDERNDTLLKTDSHLLIGTPGKIFSLIEKKKINTSKVLMFIFDEADLLLNSQEGRDLRKMFNRLRNQQIQYCLFSATFNDDSKKWINDNIKGAKIKIEVPPNKLFVDKLKQFKLKCEGEVEKEKILFELFDNIAYGQTIIFTQTREKAKRLKELWQMKDGKQGPEVEILIGDKNVSFEERDQAIERFKTGKSRILITTNALARGVDVLNASLVVNFDPPETKDGSADVETYLHRVGRSARFGRPGIALNLFHHDDCTENILNVISKHYQRDMEILKDWETLDFHLQDVFANLQ